VARGGNVDVAAGAGTVKELKGCGDSKGDVDKAEPLGMVDEGETPPLFVPVSLPCSLFGLSIE
jgi:hypothetical protein